MGIGSLLGVGVIGSFGRYNFLTFVMFSVLNLPTFYHYHFLH